VNEIVEEIEDKDNIIFNDRSIIFESWLKNLEHRLRFSITYKGSESPCPHILQICGHSVEIFDFHRPTRKAKLFCGSPCPHYTSGS